MHIPSESQEEREQQLAASLEALDDRIALLRNSIQQLLEEDSAGLEDDALIVEQLTRQNDDLEKLAAERDAIEQAIAVDKQEQVTNTSSE